MHGPVVAGDVEGRAEARRPVVAAVDVAAGLAPPWIHVAAHAEVERQAVGRVPRVLSEERLTAVPRRQVVAVAVGVVGHAAVVVEVDAVRVAVAVARGAALELGAELQLVAAELVGVVGDRLALTWSRVRSA